MNAETSLALALSKQASVDEFDDLSIEELESLVKTAKKEEKKHPGIGQEVAVGALGTAAGGAAAHHGAKLVTRHRLNKVVGEAVDKLNKLEGRNRHIKYQTGRIEGEAAKRMGKVVRQMGAVRQYGVPAAAIASGAGLMLLNRHRYTKKHEIPTGKKKAAEVEKVAFGEKDLRMWLNTAHRYKDSLKNSGPGARAVMGAGGGFLASKMMGRGDEYVTPEGNVARKSTAKRTAALMALGASGGALSHESGRKWVRETADSLKKRFKKESSAKLAWRLEMEKIAVLPPQLLSAGARLGQMATRIGTNATHVNALGGAAIGAGVNMARNMMKPRDQRQSMLAAGVKGGLAGGVVGAAAKPFLQAAAPHIQKATGYNLKLPPPAALGGAAQAAGGAARPAPVVGGAPGTPSHTVAPTAEIPSVDPSTIARAAGARTTTPPQTSVGQMHSEIEQARLVHQWRKSGLGENEIAARLKATGPRAVKATQPIDAGQSYAMSQAAAQQSQAAQAQRKGLFGGYRAPPNPHQGVILPPQ